MSREKSASWELRPGVLPSDGTNGDGPAPVYGTCRTAGPFRGEERRIGPVELSRSSSSVGLPSLETWMVRPGRARAPGGGRDIVGALAAQLLPFVKPLEFDSKGTGTYKYSILACN